MRYVCFMMLMLSSVCVYAQEPPPQDLELSAVEYAAQADAYNIYCGKESALADQFIEKFQQKKGIPKSEIDSFITVKGDAFLKTATALKADGLDCQNLDLMLKRFQVMRELRNISYRLNGLDPEKNLGSDTPNLEDLMPPSPFEGQK